MARPKAKIADDADKPWIDNYPPLRDFLRDHDARCDWQVPNGPNYGRTGSPAAYIEQWRFPNNRTIIVVVHAFRNGWDVFTNFQDNTISGTLAAVAKHCGLKT